MISNDVKEFVKKLNFSGGKYSDRETFKDVITLTAYFINATMLNNKEYAKQFDELMKKYTSDEQKQVWQVLLELIELYNKQEQANDIMTEVFSELGLGNKNTGQFFTPTSISDFMSEITATNIDLKQEINRKGYITLHEPACGAGGMILAFARRIKDADFETWRNLYVEAWDIDVLCTYMTYLQLSLYDIPAKVVNGDTLSLKENFVLYTPAYYVFKYLEKEGKLTVPICSYCKKEIVEEPKMSQINEGKKLCAQCYKTESVIKAVKDILS